MIRTYGAFSRNPLYNNLQIRKGVKVSADVKYLLSKEDIQSKSLEEIASIVRNEFSFDNFKWQQENNIKIAILSQYTLYIKQKDCNISQIHRKTTYKQI